MPGTNLKAWLFHERHNPKVGGFDTVDPAAQGDATEQWLRGDIELDRLRDGGRGGSGGRLCGGHGER